MPGALLTSLLWLSVLLSTVNAATSSKPNTSKRTINIIVIIVIVIFIILAIAGLILLIFLCRRHERTKKEKMNTMITVSTVQPYQPQSTGGYQRPNSVVVHQDGDWWQPPPDQSDAGTNATRRSMYLGPPPNASASSRYSAHLGTPAGHRQSTYSTTSSQSSRNHAARHSSSLAANAQIVMDRTAVAGPAVPPPPPPPPPLVGSMGARSTSTHGDHHNLPYASQGPSRTSSYTQHAGGAVEANVNLQGAAQPFQIPAPNRMPAPPAFTASPPKRSTQPGPGPSSASADAGPPPAAKPLLPQPTGTSIYSTTHPYELSAMTKSTSGHPGT